MYVCLLSYIVEIIYVFFEHVSETKKSKICLNYLEDIKEIKQCWSIKMDFCIHKL